MNRQVLILAFSLIAGGGLGWVTARAPAIAAAPLALSPPSPQHGRIAAREARERFAAFGLAAAPAERTYEPPPPPDIAVLFRRDLTAIEQREDGLVVWIVDFTQQFGRRALRRGDVYQDGWRVSAISPQFIELRRRRETRRVAAFEPPMVEP